MLPLPWVVWVPARPSVRPRASPRGAPWGASPPSWVPRHRGAQPDAPPLLARIRACRLGTCGFPGGACWTPALASSSGGGPSAVWGLGRDGPLTQWRARCPPPPTLTFAAPFARALRPGPRAGPRPALSPPLLVPSRHPLTDSGSLGDTSWGFRTLPAPPPGSPQPPSTRARPAGVSGGAGPARLVSVAVRSARSGAA